MSSVCTVRSVEISVLGGNYQTYQPLCRDIPSICAIISDSCFCLDSPSIPVWLPDFHDTIVLTWKVTFCPDLPCQATEDNFSTMAKQSETNWTLTSRCLLKLKLECTHTVNICYLKDQFADIAVLVLTQELYW